MEQSNQNQLNIDPADQNFVHPPQIPSELGRASQNLGGQVKILEEEKNQGGYFYYYLLVLVIIVSGVWLFWKGGGGQPSSEVAGESQAAQSEMVQEGTSVLQGTLRISDNPARGNLMLVQGDKSTRYIFTVRDFNSLIGKEVEVRIENTEKGFKLLDIVAK